VEARGPCSKGDVLTKDSAGVPLELPPEWNVKLTHHTDGFHADDHEWSGVLTVRETSNAGRDWWSYERPIPLATNGDTARAHLKVSSIVDEVRTQSNQADVDGQLRIAIAFEHATTLSAPERTQASRQSARIDLSVAGGAVAPVVTEADRTYQTSAKKGRPVLALGLLVAVAAIEAPIQGIRRGLAPWERYAGVDVLDGQRAPIPRKHTAIPLDRLMAVARAEAESVIVDEDRGIALLAGDMPLVADLPRWDEPSEPEAELAEDAIEP